MELLDRYLQAVQFWLPAKLKQDVTAELSEDLRSQMEEKEGELGRPLTEPELEAILKRCGSPLTVASHYLPKRYLISPTMFPLFQFVMGVAIAGMVVPRILLGIGFAILDPADRDILDVGNIFETIIFLAFFITVAFAIFERSGIKEQILDYWNPRKLPALRNPNAIPRSASLFEIAAALIFNLWFVGLFWPRPVIDLYGIHLAMAPIWRPIFFSFEALAIVNLAMSTANLFRPYWTPLRAGLRLFTDASGGALFCWLLKAQVLTGISAGSLSTAQGASITNALNWWTVRMFPFAVLVMLIIAAINIYRFMRLRKAGPPSASTLARA